MTTALLRPSEAARELRVGRSTVYQMLRDGRLPAVRLGRRIVRIPRHAIEEIAARALQGGGS
jgi:excisionase family DNA binding protein